jgi:ribosomal protein S12 methylthiotransferase accessory factor
LRIGELKTLLALAVGDQEAILEGCDWIHHFADLDPARRLVYRCVESMLKVANVDDFRRSLVLLYGAATVRQAEALLARSERFFGLETLGPDMQGSAMHQTLLAAYDKLFAA